MFLYLDVNHFWDRVQDFYIWGRSVKIIETSSSKLTSATAEVCNIGHRLSLPIYEDKALKWNSTYIKSKSSNNYI